jgi:CBS domain containing-hemolysin-like protein
MFQTPNHPSLVLGPADRTCGRCEGAIRASKEENPLPRGRLPYEDYQTVGAMVMAGLRRVLAVGNSFEWEGWRFEAVDMDGSHVDKVLATLPDTQQAAPS